MSGGCVVGGGRNCDNDLTHFEGEGMSAKMHHKECAFYYDLFASAPHATRNQVSFPTGCVHFHKKVVIKGIKQVVIKGAIGRKKVVINSAPFSTFGHTSYFALVWQGTPV